jgi:dihydroorotate dehydrogenase electron transfer subunit
MTPFSHSASKVTENIRLAQDTYKVRLHCPAIARAIRPGQFVMLRLPDRTDPLLGRPFALYDVAGDEVDIVYLVVGKMTARLAKIAPGEVLEAWGPLGNGFLDPGRVRHVGLVAGGIGQTPFLAATRWLLGSTGYGGDPPRRLAERVSLYYGARSARYLAGVDDFQAAGAEVHLATDDGSEGVKGYVTALLEQSGLPDLLIGCGPEPMLHTLAALAARTGTPCHVSLETPMACGLGICFSCVVPVRTAGGVDYKRCCIDGPVFDAASVDWGHG